MLCSICHKNMAVIFIKKSNDNTDNDNNSKSQMEGLCYSCAKEKGINPLEVLAKQANLSEEELSDMSEQFENIFNDLSENVNMDDLNNTDDIEGNSIPLGSIFSNIFNAKSNNSSNKQDDTNDTKKKIKTEKKPKEKKKSFLDIYGTNLTNKARKNEIDNVIGRSNEIGRVIQILNRRSKNNPCLIGEPGVR